MSCSRDTASAIADVASPASAKPPSSANEKRLKCKAFMIDERLVSLVLYLQSVRTEVDLQAFRFLLGLVKIIAEYADRDDQCADDEIQNIAVDGHPCLHGSRNLTVKCIGMVAILKATMGTATP